MTNFDQAHMNPEIQGEHIVSHSFYTKEQIGQMGITELSNLLGVKPNFNVGYPEIRNLKNQVLQNQVMQPERQVPQIGSIIRSYSTSVDALDPQHVETASQIDETTHDEDVEQGLISDPATPKDDTYYDRYLNGLLNKFVFVGDSEDVADDSESNADMHEDAQQKPYINENLDSLNGQEDVDDIDAETFISEDGAQNSTSKEEQAGEKAENIDEKNTTERTANDILLPREVANFFNDKVVRYIQDYVHENGHVEGVFGTSEKPSETFTQIQNELRYLLHETSTDENGVVDTFAIRVNADRINSTLAHVYESISEQLLEQKRQQEAPVSTEKQDEIVEVQPASVQLQTIHLPAQVVSTGESAPRVNTQETEAEKEERLIIEGASSLFADYKEMIKRTSGEDTVENRGYFAVKRVHDVLTQAMSQEDATQASDMYNNSRLKRIMHRYLLVVAQNEFKDKPNSEILVRKFVQSHAQQINEHVLKIDAHYKQKDNRRSAIGRIGALLSRRNKH